MTPTEALQAICEAWNRLDNDALADLFARRRRLRGSAATSARRAVARTSAPSTRRRWPRSRSARSRSSHGRRARRSRGSWRACSARRSPTAAGASTSRSRWRRAARRPHRAAHRVLRHAPRSYERGRPRRASASRSPTPSAARPYFERTLAAGALGFMVYNHTYMPHRLRARPASRIRRDHRGRDAVGRRRRAPGRSCAARTRCSFADYLSPRDLLDLAVGRCRFTPVCDPRGAGHGRLHRAAAVRGHRLVLALATATSRCGPTASRSRAARDVEVRGGRRRAAAAAGPARRGRARAALRRRPRRRCGASTAPSRRRRRAVRRLEHRLEQGGRVTRSTRSARERCLELWDAIVDGRRAARPARHRAQHHARRRAGHHRHAVPHELGHDRARGRARAAARPRRRATSWAATRSSPSARAARAARTIGLVVDGAPVPVPRGLLAGARRPTAARSASRAGPCSRTRSSTTSRSRSSTPASATTHELVVRAPDGDRAARVHAIPFV